MNTYKNKLEYQTGLKLKEATQNEIGKTYWNGYWAKTYKVLDIFQSEIWGECYKVQWEDGHITTHSTRFEAGYDSEVIGGIEQ